MRFLDGNERKNSLWRSEIQAAVDDAKKGVRTRGCIGAFKRYGNRCIYGKSVIENTSGINAFISGGTHEAVDGDKGQGEMENMCLTSPVQYEKYRCADDLNGKSINNQLLIFPHISFEISKTRMGLMHFQEISALSESFATSGCRLGLVSTNGVRIVESQETIWEICARIPYQLQRDRHCVLSGFEIKSDIPMREKRISYRDIAAALPEIRGISV